MSDTVLKELQDGVLILTLNRPKKKNAFSREQWQAFADAMTEANNNSAVAAVLVTGAGNDFSSGTDLNDFTEEQGDAPHPFEACAEAVMNFDKPLVCAAKGICIGGGATLMLHADIVYVGESLRMRFPFTNLGLVPEFGSSYLLSQIVGTRKAGEIMLLAEWMGAERAMDLDLATATFSDDKLLDCALDKAKELAQWPINSLVATKRLLKADHRAGLEAALKAEAKEMVRLGGSPENIEAVMAILEKRSPDFSQFR
ncbi:enoyl-CoA hydratase/carnithine racemase [Sinobacterium caligoides]|uniref:Enoyl-CoA hydratase/carnithine racemase n=1 Tax=Sinobacterium caligoides TaxID=933926 RepID=A0A3N2DYM7_9GAMM|nr:enoyl-CoA hydratase-related protein [Sinobacterium caligoides]ROS04953.1 enoyl-CoA hydratase/carnithine racemase [Sinobacterium caligoides]